MLSAADILVTATAAVYGNDGQLLVEIDPTIPDLPFELSIEYPSGFTVYETLFSYTYLLTNLGPGQYTVNLTTAAGCTSTVKVLLLRCKKYGSSYLCFFPAEPAPVDLAMFVTTDPDGPLLTGGVDPKDLTYELHHALPPDAPADIFDEVYGKSVDLVAELQVYGATPYDVPSQSELDTDAPIVIKFSQFGLLEWVYHNLDSGPGKPLDGKSSEQPQGGLAEVFPNPASTVVHCQFYAPQDGQATLVWTDMLGRQLHPIRIQVSKGQNTYVLEGLEHLPNGLYYLNLIQDNEIQDSKRVVIQH